MIVACQLVVAKLPRNLKMYAVFWRSYAHGLYLRLAVQSPIRY